MCIDNLLHKLEKEQGLPQICNVYATTAVEFPPFGLVQGAQWKGV